MVKLTDEPPEPTEEAELNGVLVKTRRDYLNFLQDQLEEHLPYYESQLRDYVARLEKLQEVPGYAEENVDETSEELRQKTAILVNIQKERKDITAWLWKYYRAKRRPFATLKECRQQIEKLFAGKEKFYVTCKEVEELLRKLHGTSACD